MEQLEGLFEAFETLVKVLSDYAHQVGVALSSCLELNTNLSKNMHRADRETRRRERQAMNIQARQPAPLVTRPPDPPRIKRRIMPCQRY